MKSQFALQADELVVINQGRVTHQGACSDAATHLALEQVFDNRISIKTLSNRWVTLPKV